ncbi:His Kinase A (phospho-acceptor) domain-containing protein [Desulfocicer vacuolatum DSM 3385]|uniref:histidine kinase n=1 Tax=Desulfocicer vacuolatum DSM 3385 TaxID=1121400 RepID=A0A1W2BHF3_9BACT|nr:HAMP domain-containing sensor histidine kinase [Desulfocicer vacuolatum]SMC72311.1 His Kinase A (phospho-acceptor) domain-containing protein [Desulfocicer vacuolatum DSM 3385]
MTSKRSIFLFWALFLVPSLIVALLALRLLAHEQERLSRSALLSLSQRAQAVADTIHVTMQAVQDNMARSLLQLPPTTRLEALKSWELSNPLIRNIFIKYQNKPLTYPVPGMGSTPEERRFTARYEALFSHRLSFDFNEMMSKNETNATAAMASEKKDLNNFNELGFNTVPSEKITTPDGLEDKRTQPVPGAKNTLLALSRSPQQAMPQQKNFPGPGQTLSMSPEKIMSEKSGWIPWFSENRLFILVWGQQHKKGPVYGVELELMTLLSRLVVDFPQLDDDNIALVLMDGNAHPMHQAGKLEITRGIKPRTSIAISPLLPHWSIGVYIQTKGLVSTRGFLYISRLLLGIFLACIISGGALLTRMTLHNIKNAHQKTSFVSSVSHELKTPLTSIRMYAELLQSQRVTDPEKTQHYLSVMVTETHRLTRLINNVLDFGRLEQGKKKYHITSFDLLQLLNQIIDAHGIRIHNQGLKILFTPATHENNNFTINSDADALEQVIINLVDNALKYAGDGNFIEFIVNMETDETKKQLILLKVCDDGPGIPPEHCHEIFEKFHRVDNSLTATHPGSGLGLSISRKILRDLGGDLELEPGPNGKGCCFTARIKTT